MTALAQPPLYLSLSSLARRLQNISKQGPNIKTVTNKYKQYTIYQQQNHRHRTDNSQNYQGRTLIKCTVQTFVLDSAVGNKVINFDCFYQQAWRLLCHI